MRVKYFNKATLDVGRNRPGGGAGNVACKMAALSNGQTESYGVQNGIFFVGKTLYSLVLSYCASSGQFPDDAQYDKTTTIVY